MIICNILQGNIICQVINRKYKNFFIFFLPLKLFETTNLLINESGTSRKN